MLCELMAFRTGIFGGGVEPGMGMGVDANELRENKVHDFIFFFFFPFFP